MCAERESVHLSHESVFESDISDFSAAAKAAASRLILEHMQLAHSRKRRYHCRARQAVRTYGGMPEIPAEAAVGASRETFWDF